ncbi:MAG TPA: cell division protein FtsZ [Flavobacteriaceae bacterium]|nr:cell division protein FtsZ [Flavobacteriaceae bacterium]
MSSTDFNNISFDLPKNQSNVIKVIGVGGGGSNAINHMFRQGIKGVDFVICNTDSQALENSPVPVKIQLGVSLTEGLGAGANPKIGEQSAVESMEEIQNMLSTNTKMVFITAGMGGGTGTGAAPIIAQMAKELDILTVGIVTIPFQFEGKTRNEQAQLGVEKLRQSVDSLIVINNNKLREVYGNLGFKAGFSKADEVLATAARGIAEVITHHYTQNIDLRDAKTVLSNSGTAIMGSASASGSNRAKEAIGRALDSPLLNDNKIRGAKNVLLLIVSGSDEITIDEIGEISDHIQEEAGHSANIIMGVGEDESLEGAIAITVIATGFNVEQQNEIVNTETKKIIHVLDEEQRAVQELSPISGGLPIIKAEPIIRHTLEEEKDDFFQPFNGYIKTSDFLKNLPVQFQEVLPDNLNDFKEIEVKKVNTTEFIILEAPKMEKTEPKKTANEQMLIFDFPTVKPTPKKEVPKVEEPNLKASRDIEVKSPIEVIAVEDDSPRAIKKYDLSDYEEVESRLIGAKPAEPEKEEEENVFERYIVAEPTLDENDNDAPADPINTPISQLLRDRTEERKRRMKEFNYKFKNTNSHIDEIEKQPAYKRMGVELNSVNPHQSNISRTSINFDDDGIELRRNNSFLHDNVD